MRNYMQVILNENRATDLDKLLQTTIIEYFKVKCSEMPAEVKRTKQAVRWLTQQTGVDPSRLRRIFSDFKIDPY